MLSVLSVSSELGAPPCDTLSTMPQCLSPQFESKSPAIVELHLNGTLNKCKSAVSDRCTNVDKFTEYDVPCGLFSKLDYESSRLISVNKPFLEGCEQHSRKSELDDFVYLEFFVDTIKPEYASLNASNVTSFTNCVNNFKLTNGMTLNFYHSSLS